MLNFPKITLLTLLFSIIGGGAGLSAKPSVESPIGAVSQASQPQADIIVEGKVTDDAGEPLVGAFVYLKNTKIGVYTDLDGNYKLTIPSNTKTPIVVYQFMGKATQEFKLGALKSIKKNIILSDDNSIDEAVVSVGYGLSQKREDFAGSAFRVDKDKIALKPATRIDNLLAGLVPGMQVNETTVNGRPEVSIRIRGDGSLSASQEPLWVIDGVPVYTGNRNNQFSGTSYTISPLSYINPDDIESMTVLKDASTTALYGADGANGVILVTTRNASKGSTSFNASIRYGYSSIDRSTLTKYTSGKDYLSLAREAWTNSGRPSFAFPYQDNEYQKFSDVNTYWPKLFLRGGNSVLVNFSASGGNDKISNLFSAAYNLDASPVKGNSQNRISLRAKTDIHFCKRFVAHLNLSANYTKSKLFTSLHYLYKMIPPIFSPYNEDGSYRLYNYYSIKDDEYDVVAKPFYMNSLPDREYNESYQNAVTGEASVTLEYMPVDGLSLTSQTSANVINVYESTYSSRKTLSGMNMEDTSRSGYSYKNAAFDYTFYENLRANYKKVFARKHSVTALLGWEWKYNRHPFVQAQGGGFATDNIREIEYSLPDKKRGASNLSISKSLSYIASASYTYDRRYTLSANWRRQGYSGFSKYSRWENFASVGAVWNIHREHFFHSKVVDQLSLKATYGNNGNSRIDTSSSYGSYLLSAGYYYGTNPGARLQKPANPGLHWEKTNSFDFQFIIGFCNRASITIEPYKRVTKDILYSGRVSSVITDGTVMRNVGQISNTGVEFVIESSNIKREKFAWQMSINGAYNHNNIDKLNKDGYTGFFDSIWIEGQSKNTFWLTRWAGVDPVSGAPMWYDKNGDLTYTFDFADRVFTKYSSEPYLRGGISNDFTFDHFRLRIMFDYTIGGWMTNELWDDGYDVIEQNVPIESLDRWQKPGQTSLYPKYQYKLSNYSTQNSTRVLWKTTSIQLRSVSLSYSFPERWLQKMHLTGGALHLIGDNLYFWSPGQSRKHNSYKTIHFSDGMRRTVSLQLSLNF